MSSVREGGREGGREKEGWEGSEGGKEGGGEGGREGGGREGRREGKASHHTRGGGHRHYHSGAPGSPVTNHSLVFRLLRVFQN